MRGIHTPTYIVALFAQKLIPHPPSTDTQRTVKLLPLNVAPKGPKETGLGTIELKTLGNGDRRLRRERGIPWFLDVCFGSLILRLLLRLLPSGSGTFVVVIILGVALAVLGFAEM